MLFVGILHPIRVLRARANRTCIAPLLDRFEFTFQKVKNNASLFNHPYSIYKDDPSPEVDAAWEDIADTPVLVIDREDVLKIGKDPEYAVAVPEEFGKPPFVKA